MEIQKIPISQIKAAKYNPRKDLKPGDAEYEKLRRSIEEFGYVEPVIWNKRTGNIVGGHQRCKILKSLGYTEIDCVVVDINEQREKALNVALNKIQGDFDIPLLTDLLKDLSEDGFDVSLTGFDATDLDELFKDKIIGNVKEDNFDAEKAVAEIETPVTLRSDIWLLGRHRLMCGEEFISKHGTIFKTPSGYIQQVPQVSIAQTYLKIMRDFCSEFGLTPSSRSRITTNAATESEDPMERLLKGV